MRALRHAAATWTAQAGIPLRKIAEYLGHPDARMVAEIYGQHHPGHMGTAAAALA